MRGSVRMYSVGPHVILSFVRKWGREQFYRTGRCDGMEIYTGGRRTLTGRAGQRLRGFGDGPRSIPGRTDFRSKPERRCQRD